MSFGDEGKWTKGIRFLNVVLLKNAKLLFSFEEKKQEKSDYV